MEIISCAFNLLPADLQQDCLRHAFQQLDQRHLLGIVPLVCSLWHHLGHSSCSSVETTISTQAAAESLATWLQKHGHRLASLSIRMQRQACHGPEAASTISQALSSAVQLQHLALSCPLSNRALPDISISSLTQLTSLSFKGCRQLSFSTLAAVPQLTQLRALDLSRTTVHVRGSFDPTNASAHLISAISCSLLELRNLDLSGCGSWIAASELQPLARLQHLQQLRLEHVRAGPVAISVLRLLPITTIRVDVFAVAPITAWLQEASLLESLELTRCVNAGEAELLQLLSTLFSTTAPRLRELCLCGFNVLGAHAAMLSDMNQLTSLALLRCGMTDAAVHHLSSLSGLRSLSLEQNSEVCGGEGSMVCLAARLGHLTSLGLEGTAAGAAAQIAFGSRVMTPVGSDDVFVLLTEAEVHEQERQPAMDV